ncbi:PH domain-containing protein [Halomicrococcus gelatinilyticus]|uniref:PH domain-containing protein n=1 Tax=Halomicrococcus gelatinilyticus TaxID=1702103 RepID=UPI002E10C94E
MQPLHPTVRTVWSVASVVVATVLGVAVAILDRNVLHVGTWLPVLLAVGVAVGGVGLAFLRYRVWRYEVQEDALYLERGVVKRVESSVPYVRVQHVDTQHGPVERAFGLASVVVYTAGSRGADVTVPGLPPDRARALRDRLRTLATASEPEDGV